MDEARRDSINKNKRSRNDQISLAVNTYLQKRNYPDTIPMEISEDQMGLSVLVNSEVSRSNSVSYTCFNSDPMIVDHSFSKFVSWLKDLHSKSKEHQDLDYIVAPLFCHLYMELLQKTHKDKDIPSNFFKFHLPTVDKIKSNETIKILINAIAKDTIDYNTLKKNFRSNKFYISLSNKSMMVLKKYLSENSHVVLLQVLQTWFQFNEEEVDSDSDMEVETKEKLNGYSKQLRNQNIALKNIYDAINQLANDQAPIYAVNLENLKNDVDCGLIKRELGICVYSYSTGIYITSLLTLKQLDYLNEVGDVAISEHTDRVYDFSIMKNNRYLLSASADKTVKLFDLNTYNLVHTYKGHEYPVYKVATSPNDCYIISASYDNSCRLWSADSTELIRLYAGHTQEITAVDFHSNSLYFVTGSVDKNIRMWTLNDCTPVRLFLGSKGTIFAARFSPDGKFLATAGEDKRIRIWDLVASKQLAEVKSGVEPIIKLAWCGNSSTICSGSIDGCVKIWDFNTIMNNPDTNQHAFLNSINTNAKLLSLEYAFDTYGCLTAQPVRSAIVNH